MQQIKKDYYPWVLISLCALFLFYKYILQVYPSIITEDLMQYFQLTGKGLGNLTACYFYSYLIFQILAGPLMDKYSPKIITTFALLLAASGALLFTMTHQALFAEIGRAMMGAGSAFATVSYLKMASLWFRPNQYALVTGLLVSAAMLGAILGQAPLAGLVSEFGWQKSILWCALLGFVIALMFLIIARDKKIDVSSHLIPESALNWQNILAVVKSKTNWILTLYSGLAFTPVMIFSGLWGPAFLQKAYALHTTQSASFCSLVFLGLAFGGPFFGFLSDYLDKRLMVMQIGTAIALLAIIILLYVPLPSLFWLGLVLFLFGFGTGAFILCFAIGKEVNSPIVAASVVALINTGDSLFGSLTQPLTGALLDHFSHDRLLVHGVPFFETHDYQAALLILPLYILIALGLLALLAVQTKKRESINAMDATTA